MLPIIKMYLTNHNRPGKKLLRLKGIVLHSTGNTAKGANALANRNYFNSTNRSCSAHYIVDDKSIVQCIPEDEIAYHVGAEKYTSLGFMIKEGIFSPNFFLIGIEMCINSDGNPDLTYTKTIELVALLLKKHSLTTLNIYRHFDITGKSCPAAMLTQSTWNKFKCDIKNIL